MDLNPVVILGMQRSGTSAIGGALSRLGVHLGPEDDFFPPDPNNAAGYFEGRSLSLLNHKILSLFQLNAASVAGLPKNWLEYPHGRLLARELSDSIARQFADRECWGFKQPLACLLAPMYRHVFAELGLHPRFVICVRNPLEIASSEANWVYESGGRQLAPLGRRAVGVWLRYIFGAFELSHGFPTTVATYNRFVENPRAFLEAVVGQRPTVAQWDEALGSVQSRLRHHSAASEEVQSLPALARSVLDVCEASPFDPDTFADLAGEYRMWQSILAPAELSGTKIGFAWNDRNGVASTQMPLLPSGRWQTENFDISAPPGTLVNGLLYNRPCRVWIRRSVVHGTFGVRPAILSPGPGSHIVDMGGVLRLDGAYEACQVNFVTPSEAGPYRLELEFLLEAGEPISNDTAARLADRVHQCAARRAQTEQQRRQP